MKDIICEKCDFNLTKKFGLVKANKIAKYSEKAFGGRILCFGCQDLERKSYGKDDNPFKLNSPGLKTDINKTAY